jgi:hypothetical protein
MRYELVDTHRQTDSGAGWGGGGNIPHPAVVWMKGRPLQSLRQKVNQLLLPQTTTALNTLLLAFALVVWESTQTSRGCLKLMKL